MEELKYEILEEDTKVIGGRTLYRIRALRGIESKNVIAGQFGGYIEGYYNLSQGGDCWVEKNAAVYDSAFITGNATISGISRVCEGARIQENCVVTDMAFVYGNVILGGKLYIEGWAEIKGSFSYSPNAYHYISEGVISHHPVSEESNREGRFVRSPMGISQQWVPSTGFKSLIQKYYDEFFESILEKTEESSYTVESPLGAPNILIKAKDHLKERAKVYDSIEGMSERSMDRIVYTFNELTGKDLSIKDGWSFMILLKLVRAQSANATNDTFEDLAAYSALLGEEHGWKRNG